MSTLNTFLYGSLTAMSFIAGVFFVRYWRVTRDRFFVFLAVTFWALAADWGLLAWSTDNEHAIYAYLPRLCAFVVLLVGIADKNRHATKARRSVGTESQA